MDDKQLKMLEDAKIAITNENWGTASDLLETLYQETPDEEVNKLLVQSLYEDEQYQTALTYALEFETQYLSDSTTVELIIAVFLATNQFIRARVFANSVEFAHRVKLIAQITRAEEQAELDLTETIATNAKHFYHLGDATFAEQKQRVENAYQLPLNEYVKGAAFLLRDAYTSILIRSSIVQILQQLQLDQDLKMLWIDDQEHEFNAVKVTPLDENPIYLNVNQLFRDLMGDDDPVLLNGLLQEFKLQMVFSYPFIEKVVVDYQVWVEISIKKIKNQEISEVTPEIESMLVWQKTLSDLAEQLFRNMG